jgi:two-component system response regulator HydG
VACFDDFLGESDAATAVRTFCRRAAAVDAPVLVTGESGTGKGLVARIIHDASSRARRPLIAVNVAGVPDTLFEAEFFGHDRGAFTGAQQARRGLFEQAHGGTLFLDEIGELAPPLQAKLLTVLEDGVVRRLGAERTVRVDVRLIAATGVDLARAVADGRFRRDLYHRLLVLAVHLPPLRSRGGDAAILLERFLALYTRRHDRRVAGWEPAALHRLCAHVWPGNVRQLAHAVEAAVLLCDAPRIGLRHLPAQLLDAPDAPADDAAARPGERPGRAFRYAFYGSVDEERRRIEAALRRWHGNKTRAAAELGMARNTLREKLRSLGVAGTLPPPANRA